MSNRFLFVGLGNPGREYRLNRHNVGFMVLDHIVERHGLSAFTKKQGQALITTGRLADAPVILAKPQTYMNLSGRAVASLSRFYDIPTDRLMVCFDDIDLPLGTLRLRPEGGSSGQNGMNSIIEQLATQAFPRLRLGIGRPPGRMAAAGYVLRDFSGDELDVLSDALDRAVDALEVFVRQGINAAMNRFNADTTAPRD